MQGCIRICLLGILLVCFALAEEIRLSRDDGNNYMCEGMYSKKSWGGLINPYILVKFKKSEADDKNKPEDPKVSLAIFEWGDEGLVGKAGNELNPFARENTCTPKTAKANLCDEKDIGKFLLAEDAAESMKQNITNVVVNLKSPPAINYLVKDTGYYCVITSSYTDTDYTAVVEFRNAYGELRAADIAKLPFYGGLAIVYALVGIFWGFLYFQNRQDILPVQNYITAILIFLVVEMIITWGFYDYKNKHGSNIGSEVYLTIVSVLSAARNSFSFFLLLIVCMGYGVVRPSLGKTMIYVRILAVTHFVFGLIYAITGLTVKQDKAGPWILFVILPLSASLTAFYLWTLNSLGRTMKDLNDRKQRVKATMYKRLWWGILASIIVIFGFFFFNSFSFVGLKSPDFIPSHWQTRWFVFDGWLNIVYLADVAFIAYLWRPTANNRRFAMSDEIAQDDEGFEIASIRDSLDEDDNGSHRGSSPSENFPTPGPGSHRDASPLPAPIAQKPLPNARDSLDGETIFAVGEDGEKFSDDEEERDEERNGSKETSKLTGKSD